MRLLAADENSFNGVVAQRPKLRTSGRHGQGIGVFRAVSVRGRQGANDGRLKDFRRNFSRNVTDLEEGEKNAKQDVCV
jgi:hypothetical protein